MSPSNGLAISCASTRYTHLLLPYQPSKTPTSWPFQQRLYTNPRSARSCSFATAPVWSSERVRSVAPYIPTSPASWHHRCTPSISDVLFIQATVPLVIIAMHNPFPSPDPRSAIPKHTLNATLPDPYHTTIPPPRKSQSSISMHTTSSSGTPETLPSSHILAPFHHGPGSLPHDAHTPSPALNAQLTTGPPPSQRPFLCPPDSCTGVPASTGAAGTDNSTFFTVQQCTRLHVTPISLASNTKRSRC